MADQRFHVPKEQREIGADAVQLDETDANRASGYVRPRARSASIDR